MSALILIITLLLGTPTLLRASDISQFANCHKADIENTEVKGKLVPAQREAYFESLYADVYKLEIEIRNPQNDVPPSYLRHCYKKKTAAFYQNLQFSNPSFSSSFNVLWRLGQLYELQGRNDDALATYDRASKLNPQNTDVRMKHFKLWMKMEGQRLKNIPTGALTHSDFQATRRKMTEFLDPIIDNTSAPPSTRIEALEIRAQFYTDIKQILMAMDDWKKLLSINPNHPGALKNVSAYYLDRKLNLDAKKALEKLVIADPSQAQPFEALLKLQFQYDDISAALATSQRALEKHPDNHNLKALRARALYGASRHNEADLILAEVKRLDPKNIYALNIDAQKLEQEGDRFSSQNMVGTALAKYKEASKIMQDEPRLSRRIHEKMAFLIFGIRKKANFEPAEPTKKDMDEVLRLLQAGIDEKNPGQTLIDTYVEALKYSSQPGRLDSICASLASKAKSSVHCVQAPSKKSQPSLNRPTGLSPRQSQPQSTPQNF